MIDIKNLTIDKAHEHLKKKDFSARELVETCIQNIEKQNKELNAYLEVYENVLAQADNADDLISKGTIGTLTGIPLAFKDNILITGEIASASSKILENHHATYDATVVTKLKTQGTVLMGRTNCDEFAMGASTENSAYGVTKNPLDTTRVAGGSSGGSAVVVASHMALGSFGSETGGSIRQPASLCGVVGLKVTYGSVSRHGLISLASSLDSVGPFGKSVRDVEILFDAIKGKDLMDSTTVDEHDYPHVIPEAKKIGVPFSFLEGSGIREDVYGVFKKNLERLTSLGYEIVPIELPHVKYSIPAYYVIVPAEASANLARFDGVKYGLHVDGKDLLEDYRRTRGQGFGPEPRRRIMIGTYVLSSGYYDAYYNRANAVRRMIADDFTKAFEHVDLIATPTTAGPAFKIGLKSNDPVQMYLEDIFTAPANLTGVPAISIPAGYIVEDGVELPLGLQFYAPHMGEKRLFRAGKSFLGEK